MKKILLVLSFLILFPFSAFATSGACSGHGGVSCNAGSDSDGSVICKDGWRNSSVSYSSMVMCGGSSTPSIPTYTPSYSTPPAPVVTPTPRPTIPEQTKPVAVPTPAPQKTQPTPIKETPKKTIKDEKSVVKTSATPEIKTPVEKSTAETKPAPKKKGFFARLLSSIF